jgi:hypothetical protein
MKSMNFPEKLFEILFNLLIKQNKRLLLEISIREKQSYDDLCRRYLPTRKQFRVFMNNQSSSVSSLSNFS